VVFSSLSWNRLFAMLSPTLSMPSGRQSHLSTLSMPSSDKGALCTVSVVEQFSYLWVSRFSALPLAFSWDLRSRSAEHGLGWGLWVACVYHRKEFGVIGAMIPA